VNAVEGQFALLGEERDIGDEQRGIVLRAASVTLKKVFEADLAHIVAEPGVLASERLEGLLDAELALGNVAEVGGAVKGIDLDADGDVLVAGGLRFNVRHGEE
jgi:hypothetical protein